MLRQIDSLLTFEPAGVVKYAAGIPLGRENFRSLSTLEQYNARYSGRSQGFNERQLLAIVPFAENIFLQVCICWEVDGRKWYVAEQASTGTPIESNDPQLSNNVYRAFRYSTFYFGRLTLDLQTDFSEETTSNSSSAPTEYGHTQSLKDL